MGLILKLLKEPDKNLHWLLLNNALSWPVKASVSFLNAGINNTSFSEISR